MGRILVALAAIAAVFFFWSEAANYPRTAARLPNILGWVVLILAILAIVQTLFTWRRQKAEGTLVFIPEIQWRDIAVGGGFSGLIILYAWSIRHVGYLVATPLFLLIPLAVLRPIGWTASILTTLVVTAFIWGVFVYFLKLSIPLYPAV
ncbi:hypothetical protein C5748_25935 [Phyllobacterium phragmitis]|uniref:DUF1468 domain-containing protein n=1 Tax=Phyllobacterium phragmitis TaxID=2670329 RepID=A0A2S9IJA4_9HYPH|nr:tripartite tricarboxylate transporter TctB family protein [Phyllobacterium phragmitis]PRD40610.1 hypothetical protein C5748_25935 [Phyllobacterium phragmitis]